MARKRCKVFRLQMKPSVNMCFVINANFVKFNCTETTTFRSLYMILVSRIIQTPLSQLQCLVNQFPNILAQIFVVNVRYCSCERILKLKCDITCSCRELEFCRDQNLMRKIYNNILTIPEEYTFVLLVVVLFNKISLLARGYETQCRMSIILEMKTNNTTVELSLETNEKIMLFDFCSFSHS